MTATEPLARPAASPTSSPRGASGGMSGGSGVRRTLLSLLACILGSLPLTRLVAGDAWLIDLWLTMAVAVLPALLIRLRRPPGALQIWPGLVLVAFWLTARFIHENAVLGFVPGSATWHQLNGLMEDLHHAMNHQVAPVPATVSVRVALCLLMALITVLVDLVAVVGRHGALAGLPLLIVLTVCGAVTRAAVPWPMFALGAAGFLVLLGIDASDDIATWGHRVGRAPSERGVPAQPGTTPRGRDAITRAGSAIATPWVAAAAVVLALLASLLVPSGARNLISDAIRNPNGNGNGNRLGTEINPFAKLKGDLSRTKTISLADVTIAPSLGSGDKTVTAKPFYLRTAVLSRFENDGWVSDHTSTSLAQPLNSTSYDTVPPSQNGIVITPGGQSTQVAAAATQDFSAVVKVRDLSGNAPVFAIPDFVAGLDASTEWDPLGQTLVIGKVHSGQLYTMDVKQPTFTVEELADARAGSEEARQWLSLPAIPQAVTELVSKIGGTDGTYTKAHAINDYFTNPANGFVYSLSTKAGDSGSDLVDFLTNKQGFCQQYAAAEAVMFRLAGIPSRVVLGYAHEVPDAHGKFTITSNDAHAWVEAYFSGFGWVPFDPTPLAGISGGAANDLPWASHPTPPTSRPSATSSGRGSANQVPRPRKSFDSGNDASSAASARHGVHLQVRWIVFGAIVLVLLALLSLPAMIRARRRRRRLHRAQRYGPEALWDELADTVTDLGYSWSPARTPQQVSAWLAELAGPAAPALASLAREVEHSRYAPPGDPAPSSAADELRTVRAQLLRGLPPRERLKLWLAPASVVSLGLRPRTH